METRTPFFSASSPHVVEPSLPPAPRPIESNERIVLLLLGAALIVLPWTLGTMHLWSQAVALGLAGAAFLTAVILGKGDRDESDDVAVPVWRMLFRSASLWIGSLLLLYILIQALNPAFKYVELDNRSWMLPVDSVTWLPSGMAGPLDQMNAFRHLMIFGAACLILWTAILFLKHPRSLHLLVIVLACNGLALTVLTAAQFAGGSDEILWYIPSMYSHSYASFEYGNHAAAYLNLTLAVSWGLFFYFRERSWKENRKGADVRLLFFAMAVVLFAAVLLSGSRAGALLATVIMAIALLYSLLQARQLNRMRKTVVATSGLVGLTVLSLMAFAITLGPTQLLERLQNVKPVDYAETEPDFRKLAFGPTIDMIREKPLFGWGAGSYRYVFPAYQQENLEGFLYEEASVTPAHMRLHWRYAHNDWLQYLAEYGLVGVGLLLLGIALWLVGLARCRALRQPLPVWLAIGVLAILAHGLFDFILQNPAVLITSVAAIGISSRLSSLEHLRKLQRLQKIEEEVKAEAEARAELEEEARIR